MRQRPFIKKQSFDFKTTALFKRPCDSAEVVAATNDREDDDDLETLDNACNSVHMQRMVENFMRIRESDEQQGVRGDTLEEVR